MCNRLFCSILLLTSLSAFAAESANILSLKPEIQRGDLDHPQGLWPLLGIGMGIMDNNGSGRTGGIPGHIKILGSYYFDSLPWVADFGVGIHNEFLTQSGTGSDSIQSLYSEFAGRYELTNRWQLGAIWNTLIDNPHRYHSNNDNLASFVGAQALKEFSVSDQYLVRVGGRAMTSVGLNGGSVNTIMAELEVSFGPGGKGSPIAQLPTPAPTSAPATSVNDQTLVVVVTPQPAPLAVAAHLDSQAMQSFSFNPNHAHFSRNSARLDRESNAYLKRLAHVLAVNGQLFERVEVMGHADPHGSRAHNRQISARRAKVVAQKLVAAGLKPSQVKTDSLGKHHLVEVNRRVQLEFQGVKNQEALKNVIDSVAR